MTRGPLQWAYTAVAQIARAAALVTPRSDRKLLRALAARRGIRARYAAWGRTGRDLSRPLLWMHAPSVGEGLQARPVLEIARRARPDVQLAYTFFSPSAVSFAAGLDVDFRDYLPFDTVGDVRAVLDALRPTALVFSKLDVWPVLVEEASARGIRLGMVSATLRAGSMRRSAPAASLLRDAYSRLDVVGAVDPTDADRLVAIGVRPNAISITGDTRYDQVWERANRVDRTSELLAPLRSHRPTLVAGSTWPSDEVQLLPAWLRARATVGDARLIIAPHEPTPAHVEPIDAWAHANQLRVARIGDPASRTADVIIVDRLGVLGDLYALADAAYVGGGFHAAGLHSVLEPAAFGAPVLFGPRHFESRDATLLLAAGGAGSGANSTALERQLIAWLVDESARYVAGGRARALVRSGLGAAQRAFDLVARLL